MNLDEAQTISADSKEMDRIYKFKDNSFINVLTLKTDPQWRGDKEALVHELDKNYIIFSEKTFNQEILDQVALISATGKIMFILLGVILLIVFSLLVWYNFKTREKEIAILRMIGWSLADLKKQFISESALILTVALVLGNIFTLVAIFILKKQTISMELPWELSAKPHFLPQENNINRTVSTFLPINIDPLLLAGLSVAFFILFAVISYLVFYRIKQIRPTEYLR